ncbi:MAG: LacI family DNA-binding transcriptional regulator [Firmicutes bacterium]|nr:LacI family DNA-binding transcriptional regulator [Bacillota bacterium]
MPVIKEVAELAKVSPSTVSRVLNGTGQVKQETREAVLKAVERLNYRPNPLAQSLRNKKTRLIAVLLPDITNPFFPEVVRGLEDTAKGYGYNIILGNTDENREKELEYIKALGNRWIDGMIFSSVSGGREVEKRIVELARSLPVVLIDRKLEALSLSSVIVDNFRGAYEATMHLISLGKRRIAFIGGPPDIQIFRDRLNGYLKALEESGIKRDDDIIQNGDLKIGGGCLATIRLLDSPSPPAAIFAANDLMAIGALRIVKKRRLRIPEDVAVIGFDDIPLASQITPGLSTVSQPSHEIGAQAMQLLMRSIKNPRARSKHIVLAPRLIVRKSTDVNAEDELELFLRENGEAN